MTNFKRLLGVFLACMCANAVSGMEHPVTWKKAAAKPPREEHDLIKQQFETLGFKKHLAIENLSEKSTSVSIPESKELTEDQKTKKISYIKVGIHPYVADAVARETVSVGEILDKTDSKKFVPYTPSEIKPLKIGTESIPEGERLDAPIAKPLSESNVKLSVEAKEEEAPEISPENLGGKPELQPVTETPVDKPVTPEEIKTAESGATSEAKSEWVETTPSKEAHEAKSARKVAQRFGTSPEEATDIISKEKQKQSIPSTPEAAAKIESDKLPPLERAKASITKAHEEFTKQINIMQDGVAKTIGYLIKKIDTNYKPTSSDTRKISASIDDLVNTMKSKLDSSTKPLRDQIFTTCVSVRESIDKVAGKLPIDSQQRKMLLTNKADALLLERDTAEKGITALKDASTVEKLNAYTEKANALRAMVDSPASMNQKLADIKAQITKNLEQNMPINEDPLSTLYKQQTALLTVAGTYEAHAKETNALIVESKKELSDLSLERTGLYGQKVRATKEDLTKIQNRIAVIENALKPLLDTAIQKAEKSLEAPATRLEKASKAVDEAKKSLKKGAEEAKKEIEKAGGDLKKSVQGLPKKIRDLFNKETDSVSKEAATLAKDPDPKTIKIRLTNLVNRIKFPTLSTEQGRKSINDAMESFKRIIIKFADKISGAAAVEKEATEEVNKANKNAAAKKAEEETAVKELTDTKSAITSKKTAN